MPQYSNDVDLNPLPAAGPALPDAHILAEIAAGLAGEPDLGQLLGRFLDPIVRLAGAESGAVRLLTESGDGLQWVADTGLPAGLCGQGRTVDRHCGHCGAAADVHDVRWATELARCAERSGGQYFGQACRRLLVVPLQHRGRVLGIYKLFFAGDAEPRAELLAILRAAGELLGLALNNARLEKQTLRAMVLGERQLMAAEVHDSLAQSLAFVKMRLPLLHDAMRAHDDSGAQRYFDDVRGAVTQAYASLRSVITQLRVPMDPQGLLHALAASVDTFRRGTATELEFDNAMPALSLAPEQESQVFHIVQEALSNVARHAAAQHARLHIGPLPGAQIECVIEDDGTGVTSASAVQGAHYGVDIMRERARRIGGALEVSPRHGGGTRVRLVFPALAAGTAATAIATASEPAASAVAASDPWGH